MSYKANKSKKAIILINSILLIIIIVFTPLAYYVFNFNFYNSLYSKNGVFLTLNKDDVQNLTKKLFNFFKYGESYKNYVSRSHVKYTDKNANAFFKPEEINHLDDVRLLLAKIFIIYYASIVLLIILTILLIEKSIFSFIKNIGYSFMISSATVIFAMMILYFLSKNFWSLFENFHLMFFPQGNYTFPENSLIITLFPFGFFNDFFIKLITCSSILSFTFLILGITGINLQKVRKLTPR